MEEIKYEKREPLKEWNFDKIGTQNKDLRYQKEIHVVPDVKPKARSGGGCGIISSVRDNWSGFGYGMIDELHYYTDIPSFTSPPTVIWDRHAPGSGSGNLSFAQEFPNGWQDVLAGVAWFGNKIWMYAGGSFIDNMFNPQGGGVIPYWSHGFLELDFDESIPSASFSRLISIPGQPSTITPTAWQTYIDQYITVPPAGTTINNGLEVLSMGQLMGSGSAAPGCGISSTEFVATNGCGPPMEYPPSSGQYVGGNQDVVFWDVSSNVPAATMAFKTKGCVIGIVYNPIDQSFKTTERDQNPYSNWVRHYDVNGILINESLTPLQPTTYFVGGAFNYDNEFHYVQNGSGAPTPSYSVWTGITTQLQVGVGGVPNGGNNLEDLATDTSNPDCQTQLISGCMDPVALNYDPLAIADCNGDIGGVNITCCTYPCHQQP